MGIPLPTCKQCFTIAFGTVCTVCFVFMLVDQYMVYISEPTGTTIEVKEEEGIPFPGLSICSGQLDMEQAADDFFPPNIFGKKPKLTSFITFYDRAIYKDVDLVESLWKYSMTLDKVIIERDEYVYSKKHCRVGPVLCSLEKGNKPRPLKESNGTILITEVAAGKWISKLMADTKSDKTYICHTLVSNVTVDFSVAEGNSLALRWEPTLITKTKLWRVFVHDPFESVLLHTYAMKNIPGFTIARKEEYRPGNTDIQYPTERRKAKILTKKRVLPRPSEIHPCLSDDEYSQNFCLMRQAWKKKFEIMRDFYNDSFGCQIPGIHIEEQFRLPVCQHFDTSTGDGIMGISELMMDIYENEKLAKPLLTKPPLGTHTRDHNCVPRCVTYDYQMEEEIVDEYDADMDDLSFYLYFSSPNVETNTKFRLMTGVDFITNVGGGLGLMLGFSAFSLIMDLVEMVGNATKMCISRRVDKNLKSEN